MLERSSSQASVQSTRHYYHVALTFPCITPCFFVSKASSGLLCNLFIDLRFLITVALEIALAHGSISGRKFSRMITCYMSQRILYAHRSLV
jgi:hypothetical protein